MEMVMKVFIVTVLCCFGIFCFFYKPDAISISRIQLPLKILDIPAAIMRQGALKAQLMSMSVTKRFIVVTSIAEPTEDVKRLVTQDGWTLVVVGDTKTPSDWSYPNVHFLSVEAQKELGYAVVDKVPYKSYTRKMIGYLYAIERGAEWIYDTDDDNKPYGKGLLQFDYDPEISGLVYTANNHFNNGTSERPILFQPYSFFGRPDIWPRGFPLQYIKKQKNEWHHYALCKKIKTPIIQQGIVKKDPDVDAIYRLLNADGSAGLNEEFSPFAPTITLGPDVYTPFNSQNTLFHRSAFFTLWLPVSVAFRVTDIWRSYFAQKLVHLIGGNIAFYPVNAIQIRNAHNYLDDFKEEKSLYEDAGRIVEFLDSWTCPHGNISTCAESLAEDFALNDFWGEDDAQMAKLWNEDLQRLNYSFPALAYDKVQYEAERNDSLRFINCRRANLELSHAQGPADEIAIEREEFAIDSYREIDEFCDGGDDFNDTFDGYGYASRLAKEHSTGMFKEYKNIALIITNNYDWGPTIALLQRLYMPYFALTIFCGPFYGEKLKGNESIFPEVRYPINYIHIPQSQFSNGAYGFYCTTKALELRLQNITGYIVMSDDTIFNMWNSFPFDKYVGRVFNVKPDYWMWYDFDVGLPALNRTVQLIDGRYKDDQKWKKIVDMYTQNARMPMREHLISKIGHGLHDFYFLPINQTLTEAFTYWTEAMFEANVFHEIALTKIAIGIGFYGNYSTYYAWNERPQWEQYLNSTQIMFHPVKLSESKNVTLRAKICKYYFGMFKQHLFNLNGTS